MVRLFFVHDLNFESATKNFELNASEIEASPSQFRLAPGGVPQAEIKSAFS